MYLIGKQMLALVTVDATEFIIDLFDLLETVKFVTIGALRVRFRRTRIVRRLNALDYTL